MNQNWEGNTIAAILGGISLVLTAIGIPKLYENWRGIREMKYSKIAKELTETKDELSKIKRELFRTTEQLKKVSTIVSIVIPMLKLKAQDDNEILELIKIFETESGLKNEG